MSEHTSCLLVVDDQVFDNDGAPETIICGTGTVFIGHPIAVVIDFKHAPCMREANARRLVSCWNALDGLSSEALDGGWNVRSMSAYAKGLENKLAVAQALLAEAVKPHDDHVATMRAAGEQPVINPLANHINNFLKGGAV